MIDRAFITKTMTDMENGATVESLIAEMAEGSPMDEETVTAMTGALLAVELMVSMTADIAMTARQSRTLH